MTIPPDSMAGRDSQKWWQLGIPGCSVVLMNWIRLTVPRSSSGDETCKDGRKKSLRFKMPGYAISPKMGKNKVAQTGLEWVEELPTLEPRWTVEPNLEAVRRAVKAVFPSQKIDVTFLAQGSFNKVYTIRCKEHECVMRVSLPVDPKWKTLSEVATLNWIRKEQLLPVPEVFRFSYKTGRHNPLGFEWILMSKVPGRPLADAWRSMSLETKKKLVGELAVYSSRMFRKQLRGIGNIYPVDAKPKASHFSVFKSKAHEERFPKVRRIVSMQFFWGDNIWQKCSRGPFGSSEDWLDVRLSLCEHDCHSLLARELAKYEGKVPNKEDQKNLEYVSKGVTNSLAVVQRLKDFVKSSGSPFSKPDTHGTLGHPRSGHCLPFTEKDDACEPSVLFHDDLNMHNILVDEAGNLTGVIDWECVSALPLWKACDYPLFLLLGQHRSKQPDKARYRARHHRDAHEDEEWGQEGRSYWRKMLDYELTLLRRHFLDEIRVLEPEWIKVFEASQRQRDFDLAVTQCISGFCNNFTTMRINAWIDDIMSGKENLRSLHDRLYNDP